MAGQPIYPKSPRERKALQSASGPLHGASRRRGDGPIYLLSSREQNDGFPRDWGEPLWPAALIAKGSILNRYPRRKPAAPIYRTSSREGRTDLSEVISRAERATTGVSTELIPRPSARVFGPVRARTHEAGLILRGGHADDFCQAPYAREFLDAVKANAVTCLGWLGRSRQKRHEQRPSVSACQTERL